MEVTISLPGNAGIITAANDGRTDGHDTAFDLSGHRAETTGTKGIRIINGKKLYLNNNE